MINSVTNVNTRLATGVAKATTSRTSSPTLPPILSFKTPFLKEKATMRVKKFKRSDNIVIAGDIDDDYVYTIEDELENNDSVASPENFFTFNKPKKTIKILKECYIIDYIQSPKMYAGLGTEAIKSLVEKAMFEENIQGRIVTFSAPVYRESSPALFFYKLGFRFLEKGANDYMIECLKNKMPDIPPQTGMMYLPKCNLHKLLRYGDNC